MSENLKKLSTFTDKWELFRFFWTHKRNLHVLDRGEEVTDALKKSLTTIMSKLGFDRNQGSYDGCNQLLQWSLSLPPDVIAFVLSQEGVRITEQDLLVVAENVDHVSLTFLLAHPTCPDPRRCLREDGQSVFSSCMGRKFMYFQSREHEETKKLLTSHVRRLDLAALAALYVIIWRLVQRMLPEKLRWRIHRYVCA